MADFSRPASGFRFKNLGMKTNAVPDSLPEYKYPYLQNVRNFLDSSLVSRPQLVLQSASVLAGAVTALEPTQGVYKVNDSLIASGAVIDAGYQNRVPCSILPFRPNASPNTYDYVFDDAKGSKVFIPSLGIGGPPIVQKIGIAEPQAPADSCPDYFLNTPGDSVAAGYTQSGVAGIPTDITRSTENIVSSFSDPASFPLPQVGLADKRTSVEVGITQKYQIGQTVAVLGGGGGETTLIQDVIAPSTTIVINGIRYFTGVTGRCVLTASLIGQSAGILEFSGIDPSAPSSLTQTFLSSFRRGAILSFTGGIAEKVFLLNATLGPQGGVCLEVTTINTHTVGESITCVPTLILDLPNNRSGQNIKSVGVQTITTGAGTGFLDASNNTLTRQAFFANADGLGLSSNILPRPDDLLHFSVNVSDLTQLTSIRLILDVDASVNDFAHNAYYFEVTPNDLVQAVAGTQTQLGATQVALQRQFIRGNIDRASLVGSQGKFALNLDNPPEAAGTDFGGAGQESTLGVAQWSEIVFPISALTRIGNDQTRTLLNIAKVRFQIICTGAITVQFSSLWCGGGGTPDIGTGLPYIYRIRGRSTSTGAKGNPSPPNRYGISCNRQNGIIVLPDAAFDLQADIYDVFRFGGQVSSWRYVGSGAPLTKFYDNLFDASITDSELLSFDNHEPFPSIGPPIKSNSGNAVGTTMTATFPLAANAPASFGTLSQLGNMLPGTQFTINNQLFTLWTRPVFISSGAGLQTYLFQFVQNIGFANNPLITVQEPALANQNTGCVFGPDSNGTLFAFNAGLNNNGGITGLRPGLIQWTNPNNPDAASDQNTRDLCPPTEPLQNGRMLGNTPIVFSPNRAWRGFAQSDGSYSWIEIPTGAGLAARFALDSDGEFIYFVAKDGVRKTAGGSSQSMTDEDLYNVFPHEGMIGAIANIVYAGKTVFPPDYANAGSMKLNVINRYLYLDYFDTAGVARTLVCDVRNDAWSIDIYNVDAGVTIHSKSTAQASNQQPSGTGAVIQQLFLGDTFGALFTESAFGIIGGELVVCSVVTRDEVAGDLRANKLFGDAIVDAVTGGPITVTPSSLGAALVAATIIPGNQARQAKPNIIELAGQQNIRSLGLIFDWVDQGPITNLIAWQPTYITQPETITDRISDWDNGGTNGAKFYQGFMLEADSGGINKNISIRSADDLGIKQTFTINHAGQQVKPYSFTAPFLAHMVRLEPDVTAWRLFSLKWIFEPAPEAALNWISQPTSHGLPGYQHVAQIMFPYNATAPVTITLTVDGVAIVAVPILPATVGYKKALVKFPALKGLVFQYAAVSAQPFQVWQNDIEIFVGEWGRTGPYKNMPLIGGTMGNKVII